jgi:hypothetical protein
MARDRTRAASPWLQLAHGSSWNLDTTHSYLGAQCVEEATVQ